MKNLKSLLFAGVSVLATGLAAGEPESQELKYRNLILENEFLSVSLLPESMGRIDQITVKKNHYNILYPRHSLCTDYGSLLKTVKGNAFGSADTFLQRDVRSIDQKMEVEQPDPQTVIFSVNNYGGMPITMTRKITLPENSTVIRTESKLQWHGKADSEITPRWDFFLNGGDPLPSRQNLFIPLVRLDGGDGKYDRLHRWKQRTVVPSDNFMAVIIPPQDLTFALIVDPDSLQQGSKFYTLSSGYNSRWYWWMAFMLPPQKMDPDTVREYSFELAVYPGLKNLHEICGDIAMYAYVTKHSQPWRLGVVMMAARPVAPCTVTLRMTPEDGKPLEKSFNLPQLSPGKLHNITWTLSGFPAGKYHISGNIPVRGDFSFPEPVIEMKPAAPAKDE